MVQVTAATFENGVLIPDQPLNLPPHARVQLMVNPLDEGEDAVCQKTWEDLPAALADIDVRLEGGSPDP